MQISGEKTMKVLRAFMIVALTGLAAPAFAQQCLHGADEKPEEAARRKRALGAARAVNTIQAGQPGARKKDYLNERGLQDFTFNKPTGPMKFEANSEIIPGWQLILNKTEDGYWFMIKDKTDPCGFAYISNQAGVIYTAQPIQ
jgi:hypothetical protein